MNLRNLN